MTDSNKHLTEDERQSLADGTIALDRLPAATHHLRECEPCAADVARIRALMKQLHDAPPPIAAESLDALWPPIRERIEQRKVVPLADRAGRLAKAVSAGRRRPWAMAALGTLAAAAIVGIAVMSMRGREERPGVANQGAVASDATISLVAAVDSAHAYEAEAQVLLDEMELRRAMLRPETAKAFDHDLHVVDGAIAELKDAIAHDPNNPALRQLLASSYRQKVDLLKRLGNAG